MYIKNLRYVLTGGFWRRDLLIYENNFKYKWKYKEMKNFSVNISWWVSDSITLQLLEYCAFNPQAALWAGQGY